MKLLIKYKRPNSSWLSSNFHNASAENNISSITFVCCYPKFIKNTKAIVVSPHPRENLDPTTKKALISSTDHPRPVGVWSVGLHRINSFQLISRARKSRSTRVGPSIISASRTINWSGCCAVMCCVRKQADAASTARKSAETSKIFVARWWIQYNQPSGRKK